MSFFFGGRDKAAPVLVKHMANDFLVGGGGGGGLKGRVSVVSDGGCKVA